MIFYTKLHLDESKKMFQADFDKNYPKTPYLAEKLTFEPYLRKHTSDFDDFFTDDRY